MQYLLDTVTLVRHFTGLGKIGEKAAQILDELETSGDYFFVSVISLMEIMYLAEKNRIAINDRLILATAKWLGIPIISSDGLFDKVPGIEVIWE